MDVRQVMENHGNLPGLRVPDEVMEDGVALPLDVLNQLMVLAHEAVHPRENREQLGSFVPDTVEELTKESIESEEQLKLQLLHLAVHTETQEPVVLAQQMFEFLRPTR